MKKQVTKNYYVVILAVGIMLIGLSVMWPKSPTSAFVGQLAQYDFFIDHHHVPPTPSLFINHRTGSQGSYFYITGTNYPVLNTVLITINGELVGTASVGNNGVTMFQLSTDNADDGIYIVTVTAAVDAPADNTQASNLLAAGTVFSIHPDAPYRGETQGATTIVVPEDIPPPQQTYFPVLMTE